MYKRQAPDLLLALDGSHLRDLRRLAPESDVRLLRSFDPQADSPDVDDPYYGSLADFERVLAEVVAAAPGLVAHLRTLL